MVMWTCEEFGGFGGAKYASVHAQDISSNYVLAIESDSGVFTPKGFGISTNAQSYGTYQRILDLMKPINATTLLKSGGGEDIYLMGDMGVSLANLNTQNEKYFYFHHTQGDCINVLEPKEMDLSSAAMAVLSYVVADLDQTLPRYNKTASWFDSTL